MSKKYTIIQLKAECKKKGIKGYSKINKKNKEEFIKKCLKFEKPKLPKRKPKTKKILPKELKIKKKKKIIKKERTPKSLSLGSLMKALPKDIKNIVKDKKKQMDKGEIKNFYKDLRKKMKKLDNNKFSERELIDMRFIFDNRLNTFNSPPSITDDNDFVLYENWKKISRNRILSEDFIRMFRDKVHWPSISKYHKLSEKFIREFKDFVDWETISLYQKLSEKFIREFEDYVDWFEILQPLKMIGYSKKFKEDYKHKV